MVSGARVAPPAKMGTNVQSPGERSTQLPFIDKRTRASHRIKTTVTGSQSADQQSQKLGVTIELWALTHKPTLCREPQTSYTVLHPCDLGQFFLYRRTSITVSCSQKQESRVGPAPAGVKLHRELIRKDEKGG